MQNIDRFETLVRYSDRFERWCWFVYSIEEPGFCTDSGTAADQSAANSAANQAVMRRLDLDDERRAMEDGGKRTGKDIAFGLKLESYWRAAWAGREPEYVPKVVWVSTAVVGSGDFFGKIAIARPFHKYEVEANRWGAVSAVTEDGKLGLRPNEFDVVEWTPNPHIQHQHCEFCGEPEMRVWKPHILDYAHTCGNPECALIANQIDSFIDAEEANVEREKLLRWGP